VVTEPVRYPAARDFPFDEVEILTHTFTNITRPVGDPPFFVPHVGGQPLRFPIRCSGSLGDVYFEVPLVFVRTYGPAVEAAWAPYSTIVLPGVSIDVIRGTTRCDGDVHEVRGLTIVGDGDGGEVRPKLERFTAELPVLRTLLRKPVPPVVLEYTRQFIEFGESVDLALKPIDPTRNPIRIDFTDGSDRSGGLIAPKFEADVLSRTLGPVPTTLQDAGVPLSTVFDGATLLGFPLASIVKDDPRPAAPTITRMGTDPPGAKMEWKDLKLKCEGPFRAKASTQVTLVVENSPQDTKTTCTVTDFDFVLPPTGETLITLKFGSLAFIQTAGKAPELAVDGLVIVFGGALQLVRELTERLRPLLGGTKPTINVTPSGITAGYSLAIPSVDSGMFLLRNIAVNFGVDVPFSRNPVTVSLGFARRDSPFNLTVSMLGGGGYIDIQMGPTGLTRLEASMEFGAMVAVNFVVVSAEVHAFGGVRFLKSQSGISLDAFIRIGGTVEVFSLVSVSVELVVTLTYDAPPRNRLAGRATLVIEVDLTLFSESVTIDSGTWELLGPGDSRTRGTTALPQPDTFREASSLAGVLAYYEAFAS
jgi:hypothetical protein